LLCSFELIIWDVKVGTEKKIGSTESGYQELTAILNELPEAILIMDQNGKFLFVNKFAATLTGYSVKELTAMKIRDLQSSPPLYDPEKDLSVISGENNIPEYTENRIKHKDGSDVWVESKICNIHWNNHPCRVIFFKNICDKKLRYEWNDLKKEILNKFKKDQDINSNLSAACRLIQKAQLFKRAVITLHNRQRKIVNYGFAGIDAKLIEKAVSAPAPSEEVKAHMLDPRFQISNSYFIPIESELQLKNQKRYIAPEKIIPGTTVKNPWQPGDELFVPLYSETEEIEGYFSVDTPFNGQRPDRETIFFLEDLADLISRQVQNLRRIKILEDSEEKFRTITEESILPICIRSPQKYLYFNKAFCKKFGYHCQKLLKLDRKRIDKITGLNALNRETTEKSAPQENLEEKLIKVTSEAGEYFWIEPFIHEIKYNNLKAELITFIDRTEERERGIALKNNQENATALVESTHDIVFLIERQGKILNLNSNFAQEFNQTREEMLETEIWQYLPEEIEKKMRRNIKQIFASKTMITVEDEINGKFFRTNLYPVLDNENQVSRVALYIRDITEEKELQQELLKAEKLATLGKFSAGIVHQIRNPLGNINFAAQLCLKYENLPPRVIEMLQLILEDVNNTNSIISNLLNFAESRNFHLEYGSISEILEEACNFLTPVCKNNRITLIKNIPDDLPPVKIDAKWLIHAFINIINNAVQAVKEEGEINIQALPNPKRKQLEISITDNGCGISKKDINDIFEPFFTTREDGVGLGMSIAYKIIKNHNGSVKIESRLKEFTRIKIMFPY
jgi:PAS domain S-box-containing protein